MTSFVSIGTISPNSILFLDRCLLVVNYSELLIKKKPVVENSKYITLSLRLIERQLSG